LSHSILKGIILNLVFGCKATSNPFIFLILKSWLNILKALFLLVCIAAFFAIIWHRQIYKEDCFGSERFNIQPFGVISEPEIEESSGLSFAQDSLFWTHNDDTDSTLYLISAKGNLKAKWTIPFVNRDWEEICEDKTGNLYVGDFGNNFQLDRDTKIIKLNPKTRKPIGEIRFNYLDQNGQKVDFDCEAMVHWQDSLYLFTKSKTERKSRVYVVSDKPGIYAIKQKQELSLFGLVTSASLRDDGKELVLLTYGKIYFYSISGLNSGRIPEPDFCLSKWNMRQSEAICHWGMDSLLLGNEQRTLFLMTRRK
jgi:hypothetical protein